jgi:pyroglutamyl-peptidase
MQSPPPHDEPKEHDLASLIAATLVIETSAQAVRDQINLLYQELCETCDENDDVATLQHVIPSSMIDIVTTAGSQRNNIILLHLGLRARASCVHIEQYAYNEATFGIPDEQGFQPLYECILSQPEYRYGALLTTPFDAVACLQQLLEDYLRSDNKINVAPPSADTRMPRHGDDAGPDDDHYYNQVQLSTDPGRFVCNYLYCYSLATFCPCQRHPHGAKNTIDENNSQDDDDSNPSSTIMDANNNIYSKSSNTMRNEKVFAHSLSQNEGTGSSSVGKDLPSLVLPKPQRQRVLPLFVHVPPFSVLPLEEQLQLITKLMACLYQQVIQR